MQRTILVASVALALGVFLSQAPAGGAKRSDSVVKAKARVDSAGGKSVVVVTLDIQKGWHLYSNPVGNEDLQSSQTTLSISGATKPQVKVDYPPGKTIQDKVLGKYGVYEDRVEIRATVERASGPFEISIRVAACNDKTCLPPGTIKLSVP